MKTIGQCVAIPTMGMVCGGMGVGWDFLTHWLPNRESWSDYQLADSGVGGLMGQLTGQVQVITRWPTVGLVG